MDIGGRLQHGAGLLWFVRQGHSPTGVSPQCGLMAQAYRRRQTADGDIGCEGSQSPMLFATGSCQMNLHHARQGLNAILGIRAGIGSIRRCLRSRKNQFLEVVYCSGAGLSRCRLPFQSASALCSCSSERSLTLTPACWKWYLVTISSSMNGMICSF